MTLEALLVLTICLGSLLMAARCLTEARLAVQRLQAELREARADHERDLQRLDAMLCKASPPPEASPEKMLSIWERIRKPPE